jgi:hypothetical protein
MYSKNERHRQCFYIIVLTTKEKFFIRLKSTFGVRSIGIQVVIFTLLLTILEAVSPPLASNL